MSSLRSSLRLYNFTAATLVTAAAATNNTLVTTAANNNHVTAAANNNLVTAAASNTLPTLKPLEPNLLDEIKSERDPHKLFQLFKANATNKSLLENRIAFYDTVSRLAGAKRFDYIEEILEFQKTLPQFRREGFVVRIIALYGKAGMIKHAIDTFHQMNYENRTFKSFNVTLKVLSQSRDFDEIIRFLDEIPLRFNIQLDVYSVNIVIKAFCELEKLQEAYLFMLEYENNKGVRPDVFTYTTLISAFYERKRWEIGNGLWNRMVLKGCMPNLATFNVRIQFLINARRVWDAHALMGLMKRIGVAPDEVTFNLVIKGFYLIGRPEMAMRVYTALDGTVCKSNAKIYQTMIHYLCRRQDFGQAYTMCRKSMEKNWFPNIDTIFMLLEGLTRFGEIHKAKVIVGLVESRKPPFPNAKIYQTMIHYLCRREDFDQAYIMCRVSMQKNWFPDVDTICMLLEGLMRFGMIHKAKIIVALAEMRKPPFSSSELAFMKSILSGR